MDSGITIVFFVLMWWLLLSITDGLNTKSKIANNSKRLTENEKAQFVPRHKLGFIPIIYTEICFYNRLC